MINKNHARFTLSNGMPLNLYYFLKLNRKLRNLFKQKLKTGAYEI